MSFIFDALPALFATGGGGAAAGGAASGLQTASAIAGLAGTGISAIGQIQSARAAEDAAEFNAEAQEQQAAAERDAAETEASDFRRRQSRILAERRASSGATGIRQAGSPLLVEESMLRDIALGSARIGHRGTRRASRMEDSATLSRQRGRSSARAGIIGAGSTLLTGAANTGMQLAEAWG